MAIVELELPTQYVMLWRVRPLVRVSNAVRRVVIADGFLDEGPTGSRSEKPPLKRATDGGIHGAEQFGTMRRGGASDRVPLDEDATHAGEGIGTADEMGEDIVFRTLDVEFEDHAIVGGGVAQDPVGGARCVGVKCVAGREIFGDVIACEIRLKRIAAGIVFLKEWNDGRLSAEAVWVNVDAVARSLLGGLRHEGGHVARTGLEKVNCPAVKGRIAIEKIGEGLTNV